MKKFHFHSKKCLLQILNCAKIAKNPEKLSTGDHKVEKIAIILVNMRKIVKNVVKMLILIPLGQTKTRKSCQKPSKLDQFETFKVQKMQFCNLTPYKKY